MGIKKPNWRDKPRLISIRVDPSRIKRSPLGNELSVVLGNGESEHRVIVPSDALDEDTWTIRAAEVGDSGGFVMVTFPSTTMGTATWSVRQETLRQIVA